VAPRQSVLWSSISSEHCSYWSSAYIDQIAEPLTCNDTDNPSCGPLNLRALVALSRISPKAATCARRGSWSRSVRIRYRSSAFSHSVELDLRMQSISRTCSRYKYLVEGSSRQRDAAIAALQFVSTFLFIGLSIPNKEALLR